MRKLHFFSTLVALVFATTSLWALPTGVVDGKLPSKFTVNQCGEQVYFSQGNLQYIGSAATPYWKFAEQQYEALWYSNSTASTTADRDLFGWGTSGWNSGANAYQPWATSETNSDYYPGGSASNDLTGDYANADWGVYNKISNGGNQAGQWRTLTSAEWSYLINARTGLTAVNGTADARFTIGVLTIGGLSKMGAIVFPDNYAGPTSNVDLDDDSNLDIQWGTINVSGVTDNNARTRCTEIGWQTLEEAGCLFLPVTYYRYHGTTLANGYRVGEYWSSTRSSESRANACDITAHVEGLYKLGIRAQSGTDRNYGCAVRLVKDAPYVPKKASANPPTPRNGQVYSGYNNFLINSASSTVGGEVQYRVGTEGSWISNSGLVQAINAGTYTVQWYVKSNNACYIDSDIDEIEVTIAKRTPNITLAPTAKSLVYSGSAQQLVTAGSATYGALEYSLNGVNWSSSVPTAKDAGTYNVWYRTYSGDPDNINIVAPTDPIVVTIARRTTSAPNPMPTVASSSSLTYNGSAQNLVTATSSLQSGYTLVYSTDGTTWSSTIPQGTNAGDYTVYYKFYKGDNEEYIPSLNTINVPIAKGDLPVGPLPASTSTIDYDETEKILLEIDPVAGATIWYKLGDGDWTTELPKATDAADYSVQYKIVPDDTDNYNTIGPNTVTVTIKDYPTVADNADPTSVLAELNNSGSPAPTNLKVKRTIYADGEYNTICLPFAVSASELTTSTHPLYGYERLKAFKGAKVSGSGQDLSIDIFVEDVDHMDAGVPYLITYPAGNVDIVNPVFEDITVTTTTPGSVSADGVTFQGMFAQVHIDPYTSSAREQDYLFLGANSQLMWPLASETSADVKMRGFRAYFIIDRNAIPAQVAPRGTHARFVNAPKQPTSIENTELNTQAQKLLENGQLIILKNGIKYNAQGQVLK